MLIDVGTPSTQLLVSCLYYGHSIAVEVFRSPILSADSYSMQISCKAAEYMSLYKYLDKPKHILHIGANWGQETAEYIKEFKGSLQSITYIECIPDMVKRLKEHTDQYKHHVEINNIEALVSDSVGSRVRFYIANNECGSSSMYPPNPSVWAWAHVSFNGEIELTTTTCDALVENGTLPKEYDTLVLDTQGSELNVLRGMGRLLPSVKQMIIEYSRRAFYKGGVLLPELSHYLQSNNMVPKFIPTGDHGDAVFTRAQ